MTKSLPFLLLSTVLPIGAATITFQEGVNGYLHLAQDFRGSGTTNNGTQTLVGYQTSPGVLEIRTVMAFGLSAIPAGSTINSISLLLVSDGNQSGSVTSVGAINLHEVIPNGVATNNMVEGQVTRLNWQTGQAWTNTLGDYTATPMSTSTLTNAAPLGTLDPGETATFGSTTAFVAAAQAALDANLPLEFILIAPTAESATASSQFFRFRSDQYLDNINDRPLLTIDYTIPEPSSAALGILAAGSALFIRRRNR